MRIRLHIAVASDLTTLMERLRDRRVAHERKQPPDPGRPDLSEDEKDALFAWTEKSDAKSAFAQIRRCQWKGSDCTPYIKLLIHLITTACRKLPPYHGVTYRGTHNRSEEELLNVHIGYTKELEAFTSYSKSLRVAKTYAKPELTEAPKPGRLSLLEIVHRVSGRDISAFSKNPEEGEVLFMPRTNLRLLSHFKPEQGGGRSQPLFIFEQTEA